MIEGHIPNRITQVIKMGQIRGCHRVFEIMMQLFNGIDQQLDPDYDSINPKEKKAYN